MREHSVLDPLSRHIVTQDKIFVRNDFLASQRYFCVVWREIHLIYVVRGRTNLLNRHAGIEIDLDRDIASVSRFGDRRRNLRRIFDAARNIPRSDSHRKDKFIRPILVFQRFDVRDLDHDSFAGHNVGDGLRENIRPLLIEQARRLAL